MFLYLEKCLISSIFINIDIEWGPQENYLTAGLPVTFKTALVLMIDLQIKEME